MVKMLQYTWLLLILGSAAPTFAVETATACKNTVLSLRCSINEALNITAAFYGRSNEAICPGLFDNSATCMDASAFVTVQDECQNRQSCNIHVSKKTFGKPCLLASEYLSVKFECVTTITSVTFCENTAASITCPENQVIHIINANYGRLNNAVCGTNANVNCRAPNSYSLVNATCEGLNSCNFPSTNAFFGDPCVGVPKYTLVQYQCIRNSRNATACEGKSMTLQCPRGLVLSIVRANFGRSSSTVCPAHHTESVNCINGLALPKVQTICNNMNTCSLKASAANFGKPCDGKGAKSYLEVEYQCVTSGPVLLPAVVPLPPPSAPAGGGGTSP